MSISDKYIRWRHSHGFGIHSPYAFRMIQEVLTLSDEEYRYYAYGNLTRARTKYNSKLTRREIFLAFRLIVEFAPSHIGLIGFSEADEIIMRIVAKQAMRGRGVKVVVPAALQTGDMLITMDPAIESVPDGIHVFWLRAPRHYPLIGSGHIYRNPARAVLAARPHLLPQTFDIRF